MASFKFHFISPINGRGICGREATSYRITDNTFRVDCGSCIIRNAFQEAHQKAVLDKEAAFRAQVPRMFGEPWREGYIICKGPSQTGLGENCGNDHFRQGDRSCYGHYDNFYCDACGHCESRLTETGMCF